MRHDIRQRCQSDTTEDESKVDTNLMQDYVKFQIKGNDDSFKCVRQSLFIVLFLLYSSWETPNLKFDIPFIIKNPK